MGINEHCGEELSHVDGVREILIDGIEVECCSAAHSNG
jgi:hypothetical protein